MKALFVACCALFVWGGCGETPAPEQDKDIAALKTQFENRTLSREGRLDAAWALLGHAEGRSFLIEQYWQSQRVLVQAVVDGAIQRDPERASQLLAGLMASAGGEAKLHFESQLIKLGDSAVDALVVLAESEADWQTLMRALDALGKLKAVQGMDVMRANLSHRSDWVRIAAAHALGDLEMGEAVPALAGALSDTSETVVAAALVGLGKTGDRRAVHAVSGHLKHDNPRVRAAAVSALGRLGGDVRTLLEPMLEDEDSGVRFKVRQALEGLDAKR